MKLDRRGFFQVLAAGAASSLPGQSAQASSQDHSPEANQDRIGMLVDTTVCIGCRKCEFACDQSHQLTGQPLENFENSAAFDRDRRMNADAFTVVNRYKDPDNPEKPTFIKNQCMHCVDPACVSACLVGSLQLKENGAVTYDAWKCIGCRYCMVACPFEVPAYEYRNPLTPEIRKCDFCYERVTNEGKLPACAEICPPMCLTYGKRSELLKIAHDKIAANPGKYQDKVYGETEVGGTSWLYLASRDFPKIGFLELDDRPIPELTETIQHNVFKYGIPPLMVYGLLAAAMWSIKDHRKHDHGAQARKGDSHVDSQN